MSYNPAFGTPPPNPPNNLFNFPVKNNRLQLPDMLFDIDSLNLESLPDEINYYGRVFMRKNNTDMTFIFRYKSFLVFHDRINKYDVQHCFDLEVFPWIVDKLTEFQRKKTETINLVCEKRVINENKISLIRVVGRRAGEEGFWLRDYSRESKTSAEIGITNDKGQSFVEQYLSDYGLYEKKGIQVLKVALEDLILQGLINV